MRARLISLAGMKPPPLEGIVESVLYVTDLARATAFFREELGLESMTGDPQRFQSFRAGPQQVLLVFQRGATLEPAPFPGGVIPPHDGQGSCHIAFGIRADRYDAWLSHLAARGIAIESETHWERGGRSLYFRDPDNHLIEFVTPGIWPNY